ncbi:SGNH/GDSL hydrolase family protein [Candidatus Pelagibacter sp.]|nr:SGNH/GDSL hydrolase family protein [Candidatus Pelagibacter sp.]|tara:strand:+ start:107 stop:1399 length:1293 start_codon:yes stop_codon:yes gene_type:complete
MYFLLFKTIIKNILVFFTSLYISFLIIEVLLIYTDLDRKSTRSGLQKIIEKKKSKINFDNRGLVEFYLDYKKKNQNAVLSTTSTGFNSHLDSSFVLDNGTKIIPLSGISNRETILCNELGYFAKYKSDNFGFNNPSNWKKKYDFLLLGDSIVEGYCVNEKNNIAGNLKNLLKKKDSVLNLGRGANGPLKNYAILKEYIDLIDVNNILYFYTAGNDLKDLNKEIKNSLLKKYYKEIEYKQNLQSLQKIIDKNMILKTESAVSKYINQEKNVKQKKYHFYKFIKLNRTVRFKNKLSRKFKEQGEEAENTKEFSTKYIFEDLIKNEFKEIIKLSHELANQKKINFYFVYVPSYFSDHKNFMGDEVITHMNDQYYSNILAVIDELQIPLIDLKAELFNNDSDPLSMLPFRTYGHFNENGNRLISNIIIDNISHE